MFNPLFSISASFCRLSDLLMEAPRAVYIEETFTPVKALYTCALLKKLNASLLFIVQNDDERDKVLSDFNCLEPDTGKILQEHSGLFKRKSAAVLDRIREGELFFIVCTLEQFLEEFPSPHELLHGRLVIEAGKKYNRKALIEKLVLLGLERVSSVDMENQFSIRGEIMDIASSLQSSRMRINFHDEVCESIVSVDEHGNLGEHHAAAALYADRLSGTSDIAEYMKSAARCLVVYNEEEALVSLAEEKNDAERYESIRLKLKHFHTLSFSFIHHRNKEEKFNMPRSVPAEFFYGKLSKFRKEVRHLEKSGYRVFIYSGDAPGVAQYFIDENHTVTCSENPDLKTKTTQFLKGSLSSGFKLPEMSLAFFSDREIFTRVSGRPVKPPSARQETDFAPGDFVVHIQFGIGKFTGLTTLERGGVLSEYACVHYAGGDKLYVPLDQMDRLQKYINPDDAAPQLSRLSSSSWEAAKRRVKQKARDVAQELLHLYSVREQTTGFAHDKDADMQRQLEDDFEFEETPGQIEAIHDVKRDMESTRVMDRLICGDVGYGKTEVALRAAFKAVMSDRQVCLLAPTTVLCFQHYRVFIKRFQPFPVNVALLTRFQSKKHQHDILGKLNDGTVDVCIGTHRLLQKDVNFNNIGLLIIDEEQRFGVIQKEKFKSMRKSVDVLTLTATPIPRTLYMSLVGIRDVSQIETAPPDRLSIKTEVAEADDELIQKAVNFELERGGQIFYVHNNIYEIETQVKKLRRLAPGAKILVVHGKLHGKALEENMLKFVAGKADILVSTTVIENGLDIPNANTLIVNNADTFGLAQLYQLRGRVGRSNRQAYAYFLYRSRALLSSVPRDRLYALKEFAHLGSGYELAKRDLEIRGAGNFLGEEQSGFMAQVGFTLYCELLQQAITELKGGIPEPDETAAVDFPFPAFIPRALVENDDKRLYYYRRLSLAHSLEEVGKIKEKISASAQELPYELENLLEFVKIKLLAKQCGIVQIQWKNEIVKIRYRDGSGKIVALHRNLLSKNTHQYVSALRKFINEIHELTANARKENSYGKEVCVPV